MLAIKQRLEKLYIKKEEIQKEISSLESKFQSSNETTSDSSK